MTIYLCAFWTGVLDRIIHKVKGTENFKIFWIGGPDCIYTVAHVAGCHMSVNQSFSPKAILFKPHLSSSKTLVIRIDYFCSVQVAPEPALFYGLLHGHRV